jgi:hypothetical protein
MRVRGIFGLPFVDLGPFLGPGLEPALLEAIHAEVCLGLAEIPVDYTGGSHRSMGIVPSSRQAECHTDYGEVLRTMSEADLATLSSLGDGGEAFDPGQREEIGEERDRSLSRRQMLWLKYRFGVYFPWKVFVELIPNRFWGDKSHGAGKSFTTKARAFFPRVVSWIESLPFEQIGRATIMGLEANDHGTVHHDGDPDKPHLPDHFVTLCPRGDKRVFLWEEESRAKTRIEARAYWFNDQDDHGVDADPFFRYSIRVDGIFREDFVARVREESRPR